jgi:protein-L-isoaspartate(D-aspartate) O-methyltransferase
LHNPNFLPEKIFQKFIIFVSRKGDPVRDTSLVKKMKEELKYVARRKKLVEELRQKGIVDPATLKAIGQVPRHDFVDVSLIDFAYVDKALPIRAGQTISQPYTVALQTQLLAPREGEKVLEIGTGSGYQAAVLAVCGVNLYTIDRQETLYTATREKLAKHGYSVHCIWGDGFEGLLQEAPFDKIIVTAGALQVPEKLLRQLKIGGIMVIPVGEEGRQQMYRITRISEVDFQKQNFGPCAFVPMLPGKN